MRERPVLYKVLYPFCSVTDVLLYCCLFVCDALGAGARHLIVAVALQVGLLTYNGLVAAASELLSRMSRRHGETRVFREKMRNARNYEVRGQHIGF